MSKLTNVAAGLAVVPMLAMAAPAFADTVFGQIEGGEIYHVQNVTTNGTLGTSVVAACGDTVMFRVVVHNVGPGELTNVKVAATLPSDSSTTHSSKVSISADNALDNDVITATAGVTSSDATTISYVSGSTQLLDVNSNELSALPDGITSGGVNIGNVGATTPQTEKVSFKAKLNCPTPPKECKPGVPVGDSRCVTTPPTTLPNTGAGNVVGVVAGAMVAGFVASRLFLSRRLSRQ